MTRLLLSLVTLLWLALNGAACPVCNSEAGRNVRQGIFHDRFWPTLFGVLAPFPVLALGVFAYSRATPKAPRPRSDRQAEP